MLSTIKSLVLKINLNYSVSRANPVAKQAYIYGIRCGAAIVYVGSTIKPVPRRFQEHLSAIRSGRHINQAFADCVLAYGVDRVEVDCLETVTEDQRFHVEYRWIRKLNRRGWNLTNIITSRHQFPRRFSFEEHLVKQQAKAFRLGMMIVEDCIRLLCDVPPPAWRTLFGYVRDLTVGNALNPLQQDILRFEVERSGISAAFGMENYATASGR